MENETSCGCSPVWAVCPTGKKLVNEIIESSKALTIAYTHNVDPRPAERRRKEAFNAYHKHLRGEH